MEEKPPEKNPKKIVGLLMLEAGMEFALLIAVPLIGFLLLGKWLDAKYHHKYFIIIGILLGITISAMSVWKRIKDYRNMLK